MRYIIDSHAHVYPDKIAEKAVRSVGDFYTLEMRFDGTISSLADVCKKNNINKCIVNSVATTPGQVRSINNFIAESVKEQKFLYGLCTLHQDMSKEEIESELIKAEQKGLIGIKLHPDFQRFNIDNPDLYKIYEIAENRLPILFHTGDKRFEYSNPHRLAKVMEDFPKLTAIGAHFGGWSQWEESVKFLSKYNNLFVDTSSSFYSMNKEHAREIINVFGSERILFGTDYPMWNAEDELDFINKLELDDKVLDNIMWKNAVKLYGLKI